MRSNPLFNYKSSCCNIIFLVVVVNIGSQLQSVHHEYLNWIECTIIECSPVIMWTSIFSEHSCTYIKQIVSWAFRWVCSSYIRVSFNSMACFDWELVVCIQHLPCLVSFWWRFQVLVVEPWINNILYSFHWGSNHYSIPRRAKLNLFGTQWYSATKPCG